MCARPVGPPEEPAYWLLRSRWSGSIPRTLPTPAQSPIRRSARTARSSTTTSTRLQMAGSTPSAQSRREAMPAMPAVRWESTRLGPGQPVERIAGSALRNMSREKARNQGCAPFASWQSVRRGWSRLCGAGRIAGPTFRPGTTGVVHHHGPQLQAVVAADADGQVAAGAAAIRQVAEIVAPGRTQKAQVPAPGCRIDLEQIVWGRGTSIAVPVDEHDPSV